MYSCVKLSSSLAIQGLIELTDIQQNDTILDVTYGNGTFWKESKYLNIVGADIQPERAKDICCSFLNLPFRSEQFKMVVYDPPFHPSVGTRECSRYSTLGDNDVELQRLFKEGVAECWRVSSKWLVVKCQGFVHNHKPQWMDIWAMQAIKRQPFERLIVYRDNKVESSQWLTNRSLRRNHADYLLFNKVTNTR